MAVPGFGDLHITHVVLDYNGTVADRGILLPGVAERIRRLCAAVRVHVVTADTFGTVRAELGSALAGELASGALSVDVLPQACERSGMDEAQAKIAMLESIGAERCAAVGNGRNDALMLRGAALGLCVMGREGCGPAALAAADIVTSSIHDALDLLLDGACIRATLRV
ncbi:MAG: ATPase P [Mailhella sp.]|nr:ATPase P [Mailhella sp.]